MNIWLKLTLNIESNRQFDSQINFQYRVKFPIWLSNRLSISSQFDSNIFQLLGILGRILDSPVTQLFLFKMTRFFPSPVIIHFCCRGLKQLKFDEIFYWYSKGIFFNLSFKVFMLFKKFLWIKDCDSWFRLSLQQKPASKLQ